ncbi:MAG: DUF4190 domain-containing protein [Microcella sp.]
MSNDTPPPPPPPPGTPEPPATPPSDQPAAAAGQPTPPEQPPPPPPPTTPYAPAYGAAAPGASPGTAVPGGAPGRGMAITSLVLGILALLGVAIPLLNIGSLIMAIVGLVLGILALRKYAAGKGLPVSGVVVNAIAAFLALIFVILYAVGFAAWFSAIEDEFTPAPPIETTEPADPAEPGDDGATDPDPTDPGNGLFEVATPETGPGSFDEPLAVGSTVVLTDFGVETWEVTVDSVNLFGDEAVLTANEFNDPPEPGTQYAVMTLSVTKIAGEPADPWFAIEVEYLSSAGTTHTQFDVLVVDPEPSLFDLGELSEGDTATGNVAILVPSADVENGRWLVYSYFDSAGFYFEAQ